MNIETVGEKVNEINVQISLRIIELFSAGLYSSPNKAFEELVCNSYDAFANKVTVYVASDLTVENASIWVCDNGESMDHDGLRALWKIGDSEKRTAERDKKRLQIGRFGIGKLATYVLANKLSYICKKSNEFRAITMDYNRITNEHNELKLDERIISEEDVKVVINPFIDLAGDKAIPFDLFGSTAESSWTFSVLTSLKPKATEIKEGRLKWVLSTALPLNPNFKLYYNGIEVQSSKINKEIMRSWTLGQNDITADKLDFAQSRQTKVDFFVDFANLKGVHGTIDLYVDSLVDASKSSSLGRSHGIFLLVRNRLINLDDPLLGMEAFSHGVFNRARIVVNADELDENLASTREAVKESIPFIQLKEYLKAKINNEVRKFYFEESQKQEREQSLTHRLSQTSLTISKRPLYVFASLYFDNKIANPFLIEPPPIEHKVKILEELQRELAGTESIIKFVGFEILDTWDPLAKLDLLNGKLKINLMHPFIANYNDAYKSQLPIQFFAITEVLTEAHLYELQLDESLINSIMKRRDNTLRELSLSDRESSPAVAQMLLETKADSTGLEDAVYRSFLALGFEVTKIGGNGKPDGLASAILGYKDSEKCNNYSFTYDAKSTTKDKIQANTTHLATIKKHQSDYGAQFSVVVSIGFEGEDDPDSTISVTAMQQKVTIIKVKDLVRLLLLSVPKQIGLNKLKELFEGCFTPKRVSEWIDNIQNSEIKIGPVLEILEAIYDLQQNDTEAPDISAVRQKVNQKTIYPISKSELHTIITSLKSFIPGFISIDDSDHVGIQGRPDKVFAVITETINKIPGNMQQIYLEAFSNDKKQ
jgi:hypothetical protein